jgi:hypothetical protein
VFWSTPMRHREDSLPLRSQLTQWLWFPGILTLLKYPYPRDVEEPDEYETVRVHAEWGKTRDQSVVRDKTNLAVSINSELCFSWLTSHGLQTKSIYFTFKIATREGYLTKLGGRVKVFEIVSEHMHGLNAIWLSYCFFNC